jgi:SH3-like domain-containing protein
MSTMPTPSEARHETAIVPVGGLPTWAVPHPDAETFDPLEAGQTVEILDRLGDWVQVRCENGWCAWTEARLLAPVAPATPTVTASPGVPPASYAAPITLPSLVIPLAPPPPATALAPPPQAAPRFVPTHVVPAGGVVAWPTPDPTGVPGITVAPGVELAVVEGRGLWSHVVSANGWEGWVDSRLLVPAAPHVPGPVMAGPAVTAPVTRDAGATKGAAELGVGWRTVLGLVVVILSSFLPWLTDNLGENAVSESAWGIPLSFLLDGHGPDVDIAWVLLLVALVLLPLVTRRPLPRLVTVALGALPAVLGMLTVIAIGDADGGFLSPAFGIAVAVAGGALLASGAVRRRDHRTTAPPTVGG